MQSRVARFMSNHGVEAGIAVAVIVIATVLFSGATWVVISLANLMGAGWSFHPAVWYGAVIGALLGLVAALFIVLEVFFGDEEDSTSPDLR